MKLNYKKYLDKVKGCYYGKNIGGTLGAPFECYRGVYDIKWFMQDISSPIPNDDVDLQLVWLSAVEHKGKDIDSHVLAEYWNSYVSAVISEYGTAKNNFNIGIMPPLSGYMRNVNRNSNGAWIRTEIWACLCAGNPALAANYAYYDACVDHSDEGVYSAVFTAAVQAAAFFQSDVYTLIDIGLSYIPKDCGVAKAVDTVIQSYKAGDSWQDARKKLFIATPSSFGQLAGPWKGNAEVPAGPRCPAQDYDPEIPMGEHGYDAPWSIGAIILGWLYGEGDFGRSVCLSINCGEDTDCTAGTLGAILGIIQGRDNLPKKWVDSCSDKIATWTLRPDALLNIPKTLDELSVRIARQAPVVLGVRCAFTEEGYEIESAAHFKYRAGVFSHSQEDFMSLLSCGHNTVRKNFQLYKVLVEFDEPLAKIQSGQQRSLKFTFENRLYMPQYLTVRLLQVPEDWQFEDGAERSVGLEHWHGSSNINSFELNFTAGSLTKGSYTLIAEIATNGRMQKNYIPLTFINGAC